MSGKAVWVVLGLAMVMATGCGTPSVPRDRVTFAVLAGIYYAAEPGSKVEAAVVEDSEVLLRKAVAGLNAKKDLDFVVLAGDLLARADGLSIDRLHAILSDLRVPYYAVLGATDGPGVAEKGATGSSGGMSRTSIIWAFQGHGFSGAEGYWSHEILPGMMLVGLDTVEAGREGGHVDARQLEWLERTLSAAGDKAVIVAGYHGLMPLHPLDEGSAWRDRLVDNAAAVRQVLDRHPNVLAVLSGAAHFAEGRVAGRIAYLSSPSVSVWPLAYHLMRLSPKEVEAVWVPLAGDEVGRRAQEKLLASSQYRGVFPGGEDGDTACVRLFGGKKLAVYPLPALRP